MRITLRAIKMKNKFWVQIILQIICVKTFVFYVTVKEHS